MLCSTRLWPGAALVATLGLGSCLSGEPTDIRTQPPEATLLLRADLSATAVATLVVEVTAPDIAPALLFNIPIVAGAAVGTITLPSGSNRTITIRAYDAGGVQTHSGSVTASFQPGANPPIAIVLTPLTGDLPIEVTLGSFTVIVAPTADSLLVGDTITLTATILDADGNPVTGQVVWGVVAPRVASVVSTGMQTGRVTAIRPGQTTVVATYGGTAAAAAVAVRGWFAAPTGSSDGDGGGRPWDLQTALQGGNGKVQPGDTIWLRGGTYSGSFTSNLTGSASASIVVRQFPGERAVIDGTPSTDETLTIDGAWVAFWGFEVTNTILDRVNERPTGVYVRYTSHVKLINLVIHDVGMGVYTERDAQDVEIYGSIIYNNGNQSSDRSDGHAIYVKNDWSAVPKVVRDNVMFNQFGLGIHAYSNLGSGLLNNLVITGNVSFNNGALSDYTSSNLLVGGEEPADQIVVTDNMLYFSPSVDGDNIRIGYDTFPNGGVALNGNYAVGGRPVLEVGYWQQATVTGNTFIGTARMVTLKDSNTAGHQWSSNLYHRDPDASAWRYVDSSYTLSDWKTATNLGATDQAQAGLPTATQVFVRPNAYEPGRANIIVFNWSGQGTVAADVSGVLAPGDHYEVRSVQALFGTPVTSGTYAGGTIGIPIAGITPPTPVGVANSPAPVTGPAFDVFVLTRLAP